ncbi:MAG: fumarylacetoacetate hydrolase family protein [Saprospiraceae bacterium]|nr:fumarylacetoacetate hydrolase family protein [Saprospiraceae bacterium]
MKIICIGRNYAAHAKELDNPIPKAPLLFMKPSTALLKDNRPLYYPDFSKDIHYEVELVLKISKQGKHIAPKFAHKYYQQISVGLDFTARDIQAKCKEKGHPWEIAKAWDNSAAIGNFIDVEKCKAADQSISFSLNKNGQQVQIGNTKNMLFAFDQLIAHISSFFTLQVGDLIYTGTPKGVGPIVIGDLLEAYIGEQKLLECLIK